jgi:hypothetical protein
MELPERSISIKIVHKQSIKKSNTQFFSTLLLKVCHKKQENLAAIFNKFSVDTGEIACKMFGNLTLMVDSLRIRSHLLMLMVG